MALALSKALDVHLLETAYEKGTVVKYNHCHDPENGRFCETGGGSGEGAGAGGNSNGKDKAPPIDEKPKLPRKSGKSLAVSKEGLKFIVDREGVELKIYPDEAELKTIGYGHKLLPGESYPNGIDEAGALKLFNNDIATARSAVQNNVTTELTQPEFDAFVSFTYNAGGKAFKGSTLLTEINAGNMKAAGDEFLEWDKITNKDGKKIPSAGLANRRAVERNLFLNGIYE